MAEDSNKATRLANNLRERIILGVDHPEHPQGLPPGREMPTLGELIAAEEEAGRPISRETVRDALDMLVREGLITRPARGRGKRAVVRDRSTVDMVSRPDFKDRDWATHYGGQDLFQAAEWRTADADVAARLHVEVGERVVYRRRLQFIGTSPVQWHHQWIHPHIARKIKDDLGIDVADVENIPADNFAVLCERIGHKARQSVETTSPRRARADEIENIELEPGAAVAVLRRTTVDEKGTPPLEVSTFILSERSEITYTTDLS